MSCLQVSDMEVKTCYPKSETMTTKLQKVKLLQRELNGFLEHTKRAKGFSVQLLYHANALKAIESKISAMNEEMLNRANRIMKLAVDLEAPPEVIALARDAKELAMSFKREERPGVR